MKRLLVSLLPLLVTHCSDPESAKTPDVSDATDATSDVTPDVTPDTSPDADTSPGADTAPDTSPTETTPETLDEVAQDTAATPDAQGPGLTLVAREATPVAPQTVIHLSVANDPDAAAPASVEWSVQQPAGSVSLIKSISPTEATFEANLVGGYRFSAVARDAQGTTLANLALVMSVVPANGLYIELSWRTPGDTNESDTGPSAGTDLDLHLLHANANGVFFDEAFDCYWRQIHPEWGSAGVSDNPSLDRDDGDGGGPELISLAAPEPGVTYTIGAQFYDDQDFGNAFTTLRVYLDGTRLDEWADVELRKDDLWAAFDFKDGTLTRRGATPEITSTAR